MGHLLWENYVWVSNTGINYCALGLCQEGGRFYMNAGFLEIINHGQEEKIRLLQNKVDLYSANLEQYKQKSYNETQVRVDFVNSFFNY